MVGGQVFSFVFFVVFGWGGYRQTAIGEFRELNFPPAPCLAASPLPHQEEFPPHRPVESRRN